LATRLAASSASTATRRDLLGAPLRCDPCHRATLDLPREAAEADHCGSCRACLDICPTAAFPAPYELDARRCISYLTIENKGPIPQEFRKAIGNRIYGCDDCLAVCPWNKFAQTGREAKLAARDELRAPPLADLARLDDAAFRARFAKSPVKSIGRDRFLRNVLIAIGNSNDPALARDAQQRPNPKRRRRFAPPEDCDMPVFKLMIFVRNLELCKPGLRP